MIVLVADAIVLAVLALTVWVLNGAHLPVELAHLLTEQLVTAVVTLLALIELSRFHARRASRATTTNGDTHA